MKKLALLALLIAGCGHGDDDQPILKVEFCEALADSFCARIDQCRLEHFDTCFAGFKGACCTQNNTCGVPIKNMTREKFENYLSVCQPQVASLTCERIDSAIRTNMSPWPADCLRGLF